MTAREAKLGRFVDEVLGDLPVAAKFDLAAYAKAPDSLKAPIAPNQIQSRIELEKLLRGQCGLSKAAARKIAIGGFDALLKPDTEETDPLAVLSLIARLDKATAAISPKRK